MKNKGRIILYLLLGSFIIIQLFPVDKNTSEEVSSSDFIAQNPSLPDALKATIKTSCYDCHSNNTIYPWYAKVAPFSWIIGQHIENGKHELNFSEYGDLDKQKKISVLNKICEVIEEGEMPPANYLMLHKDAVLDEDDTEAICDWADGIALFIMRNE
ncbi:MAG TPA: heme-binding domain-containing protein [Bacteroidales bacterium]|nr:heme-binding domain-containing protein [Bacteroidales bacterium]